MSVEAGLGTQRWRLLGAAWLVALLGGCWRGEPPPVAQLAELDAVTAENVALDRELDAMEDGLLASRARVADWHDLRDRHHEVSEIACQNLSDHWAGINQFLENQQEKTRRKRRQSLAQIETDVR